MLRDLTIHVIKAITDETIHAVIITAVEGRAFCAGGDIKQILKGRLTENTPTPEGNNRVLLPRLLTPAATHNKYSSASLSPFRHVPRL